MGKIFTKQGAERLHREFDEMCKQFAKRNGILFEDSRLSYGERLSFSIKFAIEENKNEEWEALVKYFKSNGADLSIGNSFVDKGTIYVITGNTNPSRTSKFRIELSNSKSDKTTYGTVEWVLNGLK